MASQTSNFCIDAADPYAQTIWWKDVLDDFTLTDDDQHPGDEECGLEGPDGRYLLFLKVPEPKTVKNRMHICLRPTDRTRDEEVDRLLELGASLVNDLREPGRGWAVLADCRTSRPTRRPTRPRSTHVGGAGRPARQAYARSSAPASQKKTGGSTTSTRSAPTGRPGAVRPGRAIPAVRPRRAGRCRPASAPPAPGPGAAERQRPTPMARRAQLIDVASRQFAAVYRVAADRLLDVSTFDREQPLIPQIAAGIDAHIDYLVANRNAVLAANRVLAGGPTIQAIISDELVVLRERVLDTRDLDDEARQTLSTVLVGWQTLVRVVCVEWLVEPTFTRETLREVCLEALLGALRPLAVMGPVPSAGPSAGGREHHRGITGA